MAYCIDCGQPVSDNDRFCRSCGASQDTQTERQSQASTTDKPPSGALGHTAVLLQPIQVVTTPSPENATNANRHSGVAGGSNPLEHKLPVVTCSHCNHTNPND